MKLAIFGATGQIGRHIVQVAITDGHTVTAFSRNARKLDIDHERLRIVEGDILNGPDVTQAVRDQDAVLCTIGDGRKGVVRAAGTRTIIDAMKATGVTRLVCQTTLGVGDSAENLNFFWKYVMFGMLLRRALADHVKQEQFVKDSGFDWIIVRPAAFTDGERTGKYRHGFSTTAEDLALKISKADVADFMLKQLEDDTYLHKCPGLSY